MRNLTRKLATTLLGSGLGFSLLGGCEVEHRTYVQRPTQTRTVYVEPGWYYDKEYYAPGGQYHKRVYYYYDGRRWDRRDRLPYGMTAHERHQQHLAHLDHLD